jgi:cytochrome c biogenesis protein CcmG, thiol:disulfide interchange protein DsbE
VVVHRLPALAALAAFALTAVVSLGACGATSIGGQPEVVPDADRPAPVVVSVPRLSGGGRLTVGQPSRLPTVVNLWASWCGPCKEEMPAVERFAASSPGVRVVGIAVNDSRDAARDFARRVGVTFPLGIDEDDALGRGYGVSGLPTTLVLDTAGRLAATWAGPVTAAELTRLTAPLVAPG